MELSIIIVSYKSLDWVVKCLGALTADSAGLETEMLVIDNDSRDGAAETLPARFPRVRVQVNFENLGFARAVNQGIAATRGEFVLLMNPDCEVRPGATAALVEFLRAHPKTAIAAPRVLDPDGSVQYSARSFPDHLTFLFNRYSLITWLFPGNRWSRRYLLSDWDHASVRDVDWVSGACMLVRRAAIVQVGPMDEAFFMFNEDVDWCRRMRLAGWGVTYVPAAEVVHWVGASRKRVAPRVIVERHRGMIHYFHKHHPANPVVSLLADGLVMVRAGLMLAVNALRPR